MNTKDAFSHDLVLEREVPVSAENLWNGWTNPDVIVKWFTPKPWVTTEAEINLVPGGIFRTVMCGPDGFLFTAILEFTPTDGGALYRATARHSTPEDAAMHAEMGFHAGWGEALNQLVALFVTEP